VEHQQQTPVSHAQSAPKTRVIRSLVVLKLGNYDDLINHARDERGARHAAGLSLRAAGAASAYNATGCAFHGP
jgi:hypothetical protein